MVLSSCVFTHIADQARRLARGWHPSQSPSALLQQGPRMQSLREHFCFSPLHVRRLSLAPFLLRSTHTSCSISTTASTLKCTRTASWASFLHTSSPLPTMPTTSCAVTSAIRLSSSRVNPVPARPSPPSSSFNSWRPSAASTRGSNSRSWRPTLFWKVGGTRHTLHA